MNREEIYNKLLGEINDNKNRTKAEWKLFFEDFYNTIFTSWGVDLLEDVDSMIREEYTRILMELEKRD